MLRLCKHLSFSSIVCSYLNCNTENILFSSEKKKKKILDPKLSFSFSVRKTFTALHHAKSVQLELIYDIPMAEITVTESDYCCPPL